MKQTKLTTAVSSVIWLLASFIPAMAEPVSLMLRPGENPSFWFSENQEYLIQGDKDNPTACVITSNQPVAALGVGGYTKVTIKYAKIVNTTPNGTGAWVGSNAYLTLENCVIVSGGNGIWAETIREDQLVLINCDVNGSQIGVGSEGPFIVDSCILYGNRIGVVSNKDTIYVSNSNFFRNEFNHYGFRKGEGNIYADPLYAEVDSVGFPVDLRLQDGSPCIDAGNPSLLDPDGSSRDIGVYGNTILAKHIKAELNVVLSDSNLAGIAIIDSQAVVLPWSGTGRQGREVSIDTDSVFSDQEFEYRYIGELPLTITVSGDTTVVLEYEAWQKFNLVIRPGHGLVTVEPEQEAYFQGDSVKVTHLSSPEPGKRVILENWEGALASSDTSLVVVFQDKDISLQAKERVEYLVTWQSQPPSDDFHGQAWFGHGKFPGFAAPETITVDGVVYSFRYRWQVNDALIGATGTFPRKFNFQVYSPTNVTALYDSTGASPDSIITIPGDFNRDGLVDETDADDLILGVLIFSKWGSAAWELVNVYDLDNSGSVDLGDLRVFLEYLDDPAVKAKFLEFVENFRSVVEEEESGEMSIPKVFAMFPNYPNPFNAQTVISYSLPSSSWVRLTVWNPVGQPVMMLVNAHQQAGHYTVTWDGRDSKGCEIASSTYFIRLEADNFIASRRLTLVR